MCMLKLLLIAADTSSFTNNNFYFLEEELAKITTLMVWRKSGHINKILEMIPEKPDFILIINDVASKLDPVVYGLSDLNIPVGLVVNDAHRMVCRRRKYIKNNDIRTFFVICQPNFYNHYPQQRQAKVFFLPFFANTSRFKDYGYSKMFDLMMLGETAYPHIYPLRKKIMQYYKNDSRFVNYPHPGWREFTKEEEKVALIGENYARTINQAKIFFTCGSIREVVTFKYFEVPACHTLLMAPDLPELAEIGLIPGKHFVAINEKNFMEKAEYYLTNEEERERITDEGYHFIHNNHSTAHRAKQLIQQIESIL